MNPNEILRIVDTLHRDKNIDKETVFRAIEAALVTAAKRRYGEDAHIEVHIDRSSGTIQASRNGQSLAAEEIETIGRIGAQTAKQVIFQKIREAERDVLIEEFQRQINQMVTGTVQRVEAGAALVSLGSVEAILPRSEQIPGESYHTNERIRAIVCEVRPQGNRVRVVLSRTRPLLVQRLFEQEIPEIGDGVIEIKAIAREPGYRSKVAVYSADQRVDCVGACVGVRGNRIRNIVDELSNERIDIVRWSSDPNVLIVNALQPAEVDQVLLCDMIGRAIVLVREDQLSLAIGRKGQNVRLASKLCGWDIEIMTAEELDVQIERAVRGFVQIDGIDEELAQRLVEQGYLSYDDLSVIEPQVLMEMGGLTAEQVDHIVAQAEERAAEAERLADEQKRRAREEAMAESARTSPPGAPGDADRAGMAVAPTSALQATDSLQTETSQANSPIHLPAESPSGVTQDHPDALMDDNPDADGSVETVDAADEAMEADDGTKSAEMTFDPATRTEA